MMEAVLQALRAGLFVGFDAPALASLAATCRAARGVVGRDAVLVAERLLLLRGQRCGC